jgi:hypothetical protein
MSDTANNVRPLSGTLRNADMALRDEDNVVRAAIANLLAVRARQVGRKFLSHVDMRKMDIIMAVVMQEPVAGETTDAEQIAPQAQPEFIVSRALGAVENALANEIELARQQQHKTQEQSES